MPIYGLGNIRTALGYQNTSAGVGGTTNETTLYTITIPANTLGANGAVFVYALYSNTSSANTKTVKVKFGGSIISTLSQTTNTSTQACHIVRNMNSTSVQKVFANNANLSFYGFYSVPNANNSITVDTTANVDLVITGQTSLETGFTATSCTRASNVVTVNATGHGLQTGDYVQVAGATPSTFNADPIQVTRVDANNFTYANTGSNESTTVQPTVKRYSAITLDSVFVEVLR